MIPRPILAALLLALLAGCKDPVASDPVTAAQASAPPGSAALAVGPGESVCILPDGTRRPGTCPRIPGPKTVVLLLARLHGCNTEACYVVRLKKWDYYDPDAHVDTRWRFELECAVRTVAAQCTDRNNDYVDGVTENGQKWVGVLMEDSDEFLTQYPYSGFPDGPLIGGFLTYTTGHFTDDLAHHGVVLNDPK